MTSATVKPSIYMFVIMLPITLLRASSALSVRSEQNAPRVSSASSVPSGPSVLRVQSTDRTQCTEYIGSLVSYILGAF